MLRRIVLLLAGVTVLLATARLHAGEGDGWTAFPGDGIVPENAVHVHDPTIIQFGDRYFCFSTSGDGFGVLRSSKDMARWQVHGPVTRTPQWLIDRIPDHRSLWAPDVIRMKNGLRMYYCASERFGANGSVIGVAECTDFDPERPTEGWRDLGMVIESRIGRDHFNAIDPEVVVDDAGRHWMFFGSYFSGIYVVELDPQTGKLLHPDNPQLVRVAQDAGGRPNAMEAPAVLHRDGYYYLFLSFGVAAQGVRSTYQIGVGRSREITGPYLDHTGKPLTEGGRTWVLKSSTPMFGPGHCDVLRESGGRWLLAYHYYDARRYWTDGKWGLPTLQVRQMLWDADGWPLPGLPVQMADRPAASAGGVAGRWLQQVDFAEPAELHLNADGTVVRIAGSREQQGRWSLADGMVTIRWPARGAPGGEWIDTLVHSADGYLVGRNQESAIVRAIRMPALRP